MNRRHFLAASALVTGGAVAPITVWGIAARGRAQDALPARPIRVPAGGHIDVAFAIGPGVNVIDTAGPWEVFCDAAISGGPARFELFTVSASTNPVEGNSGLRIVPRYSYENAPQPHVVVVPAHNATDETLAWLRKASATARYLEYA